VAQKPKPQLDPVEQGGEWIEKGKKTGKIDPDTGGKRVVGGKR
jgi:hypothetical protein